MSTGKAWILGVSATAVATAALLAGYFGIWRSETPRSDAPAGSAALTAPAAPVPSPAPVPDKPPTVSAPTSGQNAEIAGPSFDIVRVEPSGESVIAGRAPAGATVELLRNGEVHDRIVADASGLFAFVPPPLPPGTNQIVLRAIAPDGSRRESRESVTAVVSASRREAPLVAKADPEKPTVLLSTPDVPSVAPPGTVAALGSGAVAPAPGAGAGTGQSTAPRAQVRIVTVDAEDGGGLFVAGQGAPGASIRLYLNDTFLAPGTADGTGQVSFAIRKGVKPGAYQVRLDDVDPATGSVKSRAAVSFTMPVVVADATAAAGISGVGTVSPGSAPTPGASPEPSAPGVRSLSAGSPGPEQGAREVQVATVMIPEVNTALVSRGDNLWQISRRVYGSGLRFTMIYAANQQQIRNPDLIYPGQLFVLPSDPATNSTR